MLEKRYAHPLRLRHGEHVTTEAFEISRPEESSDIILPHWWMIDHPPIGPLEGKTISFTRSRCRSRCTQYALSTFPVQYDDIVATAESIASIGCLGHLHATYDRYAIDWNLLDVGRQRIVGAIAITLESVATLETPTTNRRSRLRVGVRTSAGRQAATASRDRPRKRSTRRI